jgi:hypothetical protein
MYCTQVDEGVGGGGAAQGQMLMRLESMLSYALVEI